MAHDSQPTANEMASSTITTPQSSDSPLPAALFAVLQTDPISCEILRFFLENERAMDTAKGIAAWWVHRDELAVQPSLHRLLACGAILGHTLTTGVTLYKLAPDLEIRAWLRKSLGLPDDRSEDRDRSSRKRESLTGSSAT